MGWGNALVKKRRRSKTIWKVSKTRASWMRNGESRKGKNKEIKAWVIGEDQARYF